LDEMIEKRLLNRRNSEWVQGNSLSR
jgi:chromosome condensin MukBEF complex kleisin-like MukF subunit